MIDVKSLLGLTASLLSLSVLPLRAGIIANPSFEAGPACNGNGHCGGQAPWIFTPGPPSATAFGVSGNAGYAAPGGGAQGAYFGGITVGLYDSISQVLTTTPGQVYNLTFWLNTSGDHSSADFRVLWDGVVQYDDPAGSDSAHQFAYKQIEILSLVGTGSDTLMFQGYNPPGGDKFDLVDLQPVPEPASWMLMCIGALAFAPYMRAIRSR
jgi:PEP-CTERM motif-containing protein